MSLEDIVTKFIRDLKNTTEYLEYIKLPNPRNSDIIFNFTDRHFYKVWEIAPNRGLGDVTITMDEKELLGKDGDDEHAGFTFRPDWGGQHVHDEYMNKLIKDREEDEFVNIPEFPYIRVHKDYAKWIELKKRGKTFCCEKFKKHYDREGLIQDTYEWEDKKGYVLSHFTGSDIDRIPLDYCFFCGKKL